MTEASMVGVLAKASGLGVCGLVFLAVITMIKGWPALRKLGLEADGSLRKDLLDRISALEEALHVVENEAKAARLDYDNKLNIAGEELRIVRHDLANANHTLDFFIELIEASPEKAAEHAARARKLRDQARSRLDDEKAELARARIKAIVGGE